MQDIFLFRNKDSFSLARLTLWYDIAMRVASAAARAAAVLPIGSKFGDWLRGQRYVSNYLKAAVSSDVCGCGLQHFNGRGKCVWMHAASLGEYAVLRPIMDQLWQLSPSLRVVLTFFSPTGFLHFRGREDDERLRVLPMPLDSRSNCERFLDKVNPSVALFAVSEYWPNYLKALSRRNIPTFLVSAKVSSESAFFGRAGRLYRSVLPCYRHIYTIDGESCRMLRNLGCHSLSVGGNPLFDNALKKRATFFSDDVVESFAGGEKLFVGGSIHDSNDMLLMEALISAHPERKYLLVPHEVDSSTLKEIKDRLGRRAVFYSDVKESKTFGESNVLVIDFVGKLALLYRYGDMAYIGGGFTRYLHSLVEAVVYGLPVAFGPETGRKITPGQLEAAGIGSKVRSADELVAWYERTKGRVEEISPLAREYVKVNSGADKIVADAVYQSMQSNEKLEL